MCECEGECEKAEGERKEGESGEGEEEEARDVYTRTGAHLNPTRARHTSRGHTQAHVRGSQGVAHTQSQSVMCTQLRSQSSHPHSSLVEYDTIPFLLPPLFITSALSSPRLHPLTNRHRRSRILSAYAR